MMRDRSLILSQKGVFSWAMQKKLWNPLVKKMVINRDAVFNELYVAAKQQ